MARESFIIYKSFYKPISKLSDKQLGRLFRAIFMYQLGEVVSVEEDIEMAFEFFRNQFEIDESKYQGIVERNRENGRKGGIYGKLGGRPRKGIPKNPEKPRVGIKNPLNDNDNDNDNVNDNDIKETYNSIELYAKKNASGVLPRPPAEKIKNKSPVENPETPSPGFAAPPPPFVPDEFVPLPPSPEQQAKAEKAKKYKYAEFVTLTRDEYAKLCARYSEDGAKRMIEILDNYKGSKGKKYRSDYRTILNWVVDRYNEEIQRNGKAISGKTSSDTGKTGSYRDTL